MGHDAGDRLTEVENQTNGETIQYVYDGQGNRVKAVEGNQERRFLVTPAGGSGLESTDLMADANGNLIIPILQSYATVEAGGRRQEVGSCLYEVCSTIPIVSIIWRIGIKKYPKQDLRL